MREKLKFYLGNDQLFYGSLVIFVGLISFGLGRLSVSTGQVELTPVVAFTKTLPMETTVVAERQAVGPTRIVESAGGELVASKSGTKYHRVDCPGAKQIKPANIITFSTAAAALAAGYTPAANCPGLQ